jgi:hypothetical protein
MVRASPIELKKMYTAPVFVFVGAGTSLGSRDVRKNTARKQPFTNVVKYSAKTSFLHTYD